MQRAEPRSRLPQGMPTCGAGLGWLTRARLEGADPMGRAPGRPHSLWEALTWKAHSFGRARLEGRPAGGNFAHFPGGRSPKRALFSMLQISSQGVHLLDGADLSVRAPPEGAKLAGAHLQGAILLECFPPRAPSCTGTDLRSSTKADATAVELGASAIEHTILPDDQDLTRPAHWLIPSRSLMPSHPAALSTASARSSTGYPDPYLALTLPLE